MIKYPSTNYRLEPNAQIVHFASFETAFIKVQSVEEAYLSDEENNNSKY